MIEENVWSNPQIKAFVSEDDDPGLAVTLFDLVKAFGEMLERAKNRPVYEVESADVTVADMIRYLQRPVPGGGRGPAGVHPADLRAAAHPPRHDRAVSGRAGDGADAGRGGDAEGLVRRDRARSGTATSTPCSPPDSPSRRSKKTTSDKAWKNWKYLTAAKPEPAPRTGDRPTSAGETPQPQSRRLDGGAAGQRPDRRGADAAARSRSEDAQLQGGAGSHRLRGRGAADAGADRRRARTARASASERCSTELVAEFDKPEHGVTIREVAGGYKMATKPEHHEAVRNFVKSLKPPLKLSLPALETLAVIAYKQPVTAPEIMEIRGVQGARRAEDAAGPQADRRGRAQERDRQADPLQDHQGVPDPVRAEGPERAAVAQGIRGDPAHGLRGQRIGEARQPRAAAGRQSSGKPRPAEPAAEAASSRPTQEPAGTEPPAKEES